MQRKRGELGPFGETFNHLNGSGKAIRDATPQSLHHFTQADQVNQLVGALRASRATAGAAGERLPWGVGALAGLAGTGR